MKRQTFVLPENALAQLRRLAELTKVPQSRLLEVAINDMVTEYDARDANGKESFAEVIWMVTGGPGHHRR